MLEDSSINTLANFTDSIPEVLVPPPYEENPG